MENVEKEIRGPLGRVIRQLPSDFWEVVAANEDFAEVLFSVPGAPERERILITPMGREPPLVPPKISVMIMFKQSLLKGGDKYQVKAVDRLGKSIEFFGAPAIWHDFQKRFHAAGPAALPSWFFLSSLNDQDARTEPRKERPIRENMPYRWAGVAVRFLHPVSETRSVPIQILVAREPLSDDVLAAVRKNLRVASRPILLLCEDAEFQKAQEARFALSAPDFSDSLQTVFSMPEKAIDFPGWFAEHLPAVFKDHVETVTVAENDLTPVDDGPDPDPKLGFKEIAAELHRLVEDVRHVALEKGTDPSVTIGLFGAWGSGKSTLMHALQKRLRHSGSDADEAFARGAFEYDIVDVNAWKWDGSTTLSAYMLERVVQVMGDRLEEHARRKSLAEGWYAKLLKVMEKNVVPALPILLGLGFLGALGFWIWGEIKAAAGPENGNDLSNAVSWLIPVGTAIGAALTKVFQDTLKNWFARLFQHEVVRVSDRQKLEQTYAEIHEIGEKTKRVLAFFIDDLDRCTPERVAAFVESIHNLTTAGCVTVVACDEDYIAAALNARYADIVRHHPEGENFGRNFLEKIVQVGFRVPALTETGMREAGLIGGGTPVLGPDDTGATAPEADEGSAESAVLGDAPDSSEDGSLEMDADGGSAELRTKIDTELLTDVLDGIVADFVQPLGINMRRIKALRNTVGLYLRIAAARGDLMPEDHAEARRIAAFLVADLMDRVWLDAYFLGQANAYAERPGLGPLSGRDGLQQTLHGALGPAEELDGLYRLIGRLPRPLPPKEAA